MPIVGSLYALGAVECLHILNLRYVRKDMIDFFENFLNFFLKIYFTNFNITFPTKFCLTLNESLFINRIYLLSRYVSNRKLTFFNLATLIN